MKATSIEPKIITVIGVGLIGGSLALRLRAGGLASRILGVDNQEAHASKALELGLVDAMMSLEESVACSDTIFLSIPVDSAVQILPNLLDKVDHQIVIDLGSTKSDIVAAVRHHPRRGRFVASHPMWGTEYSGPQAAVAGAFQGKSVILCDVADSDADALEWAKHLFHAIGMHITEMDAVAHDIHAAYVSHISHVTSFALANTVLAKEREDEAIFELASAGFESTVRLAKSNPDMWLPILRQNKDNVLDVLNEHITQLRRFKSCLERENWEYLRELMQDANRIRRIIQ
ncbi:MAG: prephenate dehydrogenase [Bacteroidetes bacterium]|nr:prephenate dehydrogenase [Bacteroidota bacterium]